MLRIKLFSLLAVFIACIAILNGCGGGGVPTVIFKEHDLSSPDKSAQTKGNVDITVTPLKVSGMYQNPELFSFSADRLTGNFSGLAIDTYCPQDYQKTNWYHTFSPGNNILVAFKAKMRNGTDHILRMKDARIYLMVEGQDPIAAVTLLGNATLIQATVGSEAALRPKSYVDSDGSLIDWITREEDNYERTRKKGLLSAEFPIGLGSQVVLQNQKAYKLINDVSREILPGTTYDGLLVFPAYTSAFQDAKLTFYDITTKTDAAGNPTEKVTFEFPIKVTDQQMWFDKEKERRWHLGAPTPTGK